MATKESFTYKNKLIDKLVETIAVTLAELGQDGGCAVWPSPIFHPLEADLYTVKHLMPRLQKIFLELEAKGLSEEQISYLFKSPARIICLFWIASWLRATKLSLEQKVDLTYKLIKLISYWRKDVFCDSGKNVLWTSLEVQKVIKSFPWIKIKDQRDPEVWRRTLSQLSGLSWSFTELLYFYVHQIGSEYHGPYNLKNNRILLVREFRDLKPLEIWPFTSSLSFEKFTILTIHKKQPVSFDFFNRPQFTPKLSEGLEEVAIIVNDNYFLLNLRAVDSFIDEVSKTMDTGIGVVSELSRKELLKRSCDVHFFILKPPCDYLNLNWLPPKELYKEIDDERERELINKILPGLERGELLSKEEYIRETAKAFDPRL